MTDSERVLTALLVFETGRTAGEEVSVDAVLSRKPVLLIGSDSRCQLLLLDPHIAPSHAAISFNNESYSIKPTLPRLEVYINDVLLEGVKVLLPGDVIRIGETRLRFVQEERDPDSIPALSVSLPAPQPAKQAIPALPAVPAPVLQPAGVAAAVMAPPAEHVYFPPQSQSSGGISAMAVVSSMIVLATIIGFIVVMVGNVSSGTRGTQALPATMIQSENGAVTLMMFEASWCTYCRQQRPIVNRLGREYAGDVEVRYVDIDSFRNRRLVSEYNARSIPLIVIMDAQGRTIATFRGLQREETLRRALEQALA